jgi:hypothetical protein
LLRTVTADPSSILRSDCRQVRAPPKGLDETAFEFEGL